MEKQVTIAAPNSKKRIYGIQRGDLKKPMVVFVHGFTSDMNDHQFFNGARAMEKAGFSSFRFNLYDWRMNARKLKGCTLQTHGDDLDAVVKYFRKKGVRKIFVVGHSFGAPSLMLSKRKDFDAVVLWDPSYESKPKLNWNKSVNGYVCSFEIDYILKKRFVSFLHSLKWDLLIQKLTMPVKIIAAGKGTLVASSKKYLKMANEPKMLVVIKNADHCFTVDGTDKVLYKETVKWFKKYV